MDDHMFLTSTSPNYRLDTNYAKIDRIMHAEIERFKDQINEISIQGLPVKEWRKILNSRRDTVIANALAQYLDITEENAEKLVQ
jgi:hypothetical protein